MICRVCGRPLKSKSSIEKGIGPSCEKKLIAADRRDIAEHATEIENYLDELREENMSETRCNRCGKKIRFIKREGAKSLVVNAKPYFFVPYDLGSENFVMTNGEIRRGEKVPDGLKGFTLHKC